MQNIPLIGSTPLTFVGIAELTETQTGVRPNRLPAWAIAQTETPQLPVVAGMPSGARIEFMTDATRVEIGCQLITVKMGERPMVPVTFEATVDGMTVASHVATNFHIIHTPDPLKPDLDFITGGPETVILDGLPAGSKLLRIWLPANAGLEIHSLSVNDGAKVSVAPADERRRWIHYGSSISHCMEAGHPLGVWPVIAANSADVNLRNLGLGGQCHLDQFVARIIRDSDADIISMKCGINVANYDSMRDRAFMPALHGFIDTVRDGKRDTPFIITSPIFCPAHEEGHGPSLRNEDGSVYTRERPRFLGVGALSLQRMREIIASVVEQRRAAGDENLHYIDGLDIFGTDDAHDLPDALHPNREGYARMGERFHRLAFVDGPFNARVRSQS